MQKITVKIDGMACGMCESHVNEAIRKAFPVQKVTSSHRKGEAVILSENAIDETTLRRRWRPPATGCCRYRQSLTRKRDCSADEQNGKTGGKDERSIQDLKNRL